MDPRKKNLIPNSDMNFTPQDKLALLYKKLRQQGKGLSSSSIAELKNYDNIFEKYLPKKKNKIEGYDPNTKLDIIWGLFGDIAKGNLEMLNPIVNFINHVDNVGDDEVGDYDDIFFPPHFEFLGDICAQILRFVDENIHGTNGLREFMLALCYANDFGNRLHFCVPGQGYVDLKAIDLYYSAKRNLEVEIRRDDEIETEYEYESCENHKELANIFFKESIKKGSKIAFDYEYGLFQHSSLDIFKLIEQTENRKKVMSLLLVARKKDRWSLFYQDNLPLDLFKIIFKMQLWPSTGRNHSCNHNHNHICTRSCLCSCAVLLEIQPPKFVIPGIQWLPIDYLE